MILVAPAAHQEFLAADHRYVADHLRIVRNVPVEDAFALAEQGCRAAPPRVILHTFAESTSIHCFACGDSIECPHQNIWGWVNSEPAQTFMSEHRGHAEPEPARNPESIGPPAPEADGLWREAGFAIVR